MLQEMSRTSTRRSMAAAGQQVSRDGLPVRMPNDGILERFHFILEPGKLCKRELGAVVTGVKAQQATDCPYLICRACFPNLEACSEDLLQALETGSSEHAGVLAFRMEHAADGIQQYSIPASIADLHFRDHSSRMNTTGQGNSRLGSDTWSEIERMGDTTESSDGEERDDERMNSHVQSNFDDNSVSKTGNRSSTSRKTLRKRTSRQELPDRFKADSEEMMKLVKTANICNWRGQDPVSGSRINNVPIYMPRSNVVQHFNYVMRPYMLCKAVLGQDLIGFEDCPPFLACKHCYTNIRYAAESIMEAILNPKGTKAGLYKFRYKNNKKAVHNGNTVMTLGSLYCHQGKLRAHALSHIPDACESSRKRLKVDRNRQAESDANVAHNHSSNYLEQPNCMFEQQVADESTADEESSTEETRETIRTKKKSAGSELDNPSTVSSKRSEKVDVHGHDSLINQNSQAAATQVMKFQKKQMLGSELDCTPTCAGKTKRGDIIGPGNQLSCHVWFVDNLGDFIRDPACSHIAQSVTKPCWAVIDAEDRPYYVCKYCQPTKQAVAAALLNFRLVSHPCASNSGHRGAQGVFRWVRRATKTRVYPPEKQLLQKHFLQQHPQQLGDFATEEQHRSDHNSHRHRVHKFERKSFKAKESNSAMDFLAELANQRPKTTGLVAIAASDVAIAAQSALDPHEVEETLLLQSIKTSEECAPKLANAKPSPMLQQSETIEDLGISTSKRNLSGTVATDQHKSPNSNVDAPILEPFRTASWKDIREQTSLNLRYNASCRIRLESTKGTPIRMPNHPDLQFLHFVPNPVALHDEAVRSGVKISSRKWSADTLDEDCPYLLCKYCFLKPEDAVSSMLQHSKVKRIPGIFKFKFKKGRPNGHGGQWVMFTQCMQSVHAHMLLMHRFQYNGADLEEKTSNQKDGHIRDEHVSEKSSEVHHARAVEVHGHNTRVEERLKRAGVKAISTDGVSYDDRMTAAGLNPVEASSRLAPQSKPVLPEGVKLQVTRNGVKLRNSSESGIKSQPLAAGVETSITHNAVSKSDQLCGNRELHRSAQIDNPRAAADEPKRAANCCASSNSTDASSSDSSSSPSEKFCSLEDDAVSKSAQGHTQSKISRVHTTQIRAAAASEAAKINASLAGKPIILPQYNKCVFPSAAGTCETHDKASPTNFSKPRVHESLKETTVQKPQTLQIFADGIAKLRQDSLPIVSAETAQTAPSSKSAPQAAPSSKANTYAGLRQAGESEGQSSDLLARAWRLGGQIGDQLIAGSALPIDPTQLIAKYGLMQDLNLAKSIFAPASRGGLPQGIDSPSAELFKKISEFSSCLPTQGSYNSAALLDLSKSMSNQSKEIETSEASIFLFKAMLH